MGSLFCGLDCGLQQQPVAAVNSLQDLLLVCFLLALSGKKHQRFTNIPEDFALAVLTVVRPSPKADHGLMERLQTRWGRRKGLRRRRGEPRRRKTEMSTYRWKKAGGVLLFSRGSHLALEFRALRGAARSRSWGGLGPCKSELARWQGEKGGAPGQSLHA